MNYAKRREQWIQAGISAGDDIGTQRTADYLALVLNDPVIMGKDVFGAARLKKVYAAIHKLEHHFAQAFSKGDEQDVRQNELDMCLKQIFERISFRSRKGILPLSNRNKGEAENDRTQNVSKR